MSFSATLILGGCLIAIMALLTAWARKTKRWRTLILELAALASFALLLRHLFNFPIPEAEVAKGGKNDYVLAGALGICMLLGMLSQFVYRHFEKPQALRPKWDWGMFVAPVFASPIVFIPLLAAFQNADVNLKDLTVPRLMIFFVAYQNGFFWKEFFDRKRREES